MNLYDERHMHMHSEIKIRNASVTRKASNLCRSVKTCQDDEVLLSRHLYMGMRHVSIIIKITVSHNLANRVKHGKAFHHTPMTRDQFLI